MISIYIFFVIAIIASVLYVILAKYYTLTNDQSRQILYIILATLVFWILFYSYVRILQEQQLSTSYSILKLATIILVILAGLILFHEHLSGKQSMEWPWH